MRRKKILIQSFILVVFMGSSVLSGLAQTYYTKTWKGQELIGSWENAAWRMGPLRLGPTLVLRNAGYDSNVFGHYGKGIQDYTFTAGPRLMGHLFVKKTLLLNVSYSPQYVYFLETTNERTWNTDLSGDGHLIFNRVLFSFGRSISNVKQRWNIETDIRLRRRDIENYGEVFMQVSNKTSFLFRYSVHELDYSKLAEFDVASRMNRVEKRINLIGYYQMTSKARLFIDLEYGKYDFENPLVLNDAIGKGFSLGIDFAPTGRIRGKFSLGYQFYDRESPDVLDHGGLVGETSVSWKINKLITARASYSKGNTVSIIYSNNTYRYAQYGTGISFYIMRRVRLDYDYNFGDNKYQDFTKKEEKNELDKYDNRMRSHSAGIFFRIRNQIGLGVTAGIFNRTEFSHGLEADRTFLNVNIIYDF